MLALLLLWSYEIPMQWYLHVRKTHCSWVKTNLEADYMEIFSPVNRAEF